MAAPAGAAALGSFWAAPADMATAIAQMARHTSDATAGITEAGDLEQLALLVTAMATLVALPAADLGSHAGRTRPRGGLVGLQHRMYAQ
jgi:hypothetical protein